MRAAQPTEDLAQRAVALSPERVPGESAARHLSAAAARDHQPQAGELDDRRDEELVAGLGWFDGAMAWTAHVRSKVAGRRRIRTSVDACNHTSSAQQPAERTPDVSAMTIEVEPFGGLVVRWQALDAWLLVDVTGAYCVWRGRVLGRVAVGVA